MEQKLGSRDIRFILICIAICAASLFIGVSYFYRAFPEASIDFRVDRTSSQPLAGKFLLSQGISTAGYLHASAFRYDEDAKVFMERELGLKKANDLMRSQVKLWRWGHRWFKPREKEELRVEVSTTGSIASFLHVLPEDAPGADLPAAAARALAESFLVIEMKQPVDSLEFLDSQSEKMPHRTDHLLTWKVLGIDLANGSYRVTVRVQGDRIGGYHEVVKVPEGWSRSYARLRSLNETAAQFDLTLMALLAIGILVTFGLNLRHKDVRWKTAFFFASICFVLQFLSSLNEFPIAKYGFDTAGSYASFVSRLILTDVLSALVYAAIICALTAGSEPIYRRYFPSHLSIARMFSWQGIRTRRFFIGCVAGITLTFFFFAYETGFYLLANKLGAWAPAEVPYSDLLNTRFPWIFVLLGGFFPAVSEEWMFRMFSIPFLQRLLSSRWVAVILASFIWGFGHANYPNQPFFIRGIEVGIVGLVLSWAMFRFGILAPLIAHYSIDAFYSAFLLLRSGNPYFVASGAVTAGINLLPLLVAGGAYLCKKRFVDDSAVLNGSHEAASVLSTSRAPLHPSSLPAYRPLTRAGSVSAFVLLIAGFAGLLFHAPRFAESFRFRITSSQALASARSFIAGLGFDTNGYRFNAQPQNRVNATASQYIYSRSGIPGLNSMYGPQIVPFEWQTRFYKPLEKEEFRVSINPVNGAVTGFRRLLSEDAPGATLPYATAAHIASAFVRSRGYDLSDYRLSETVSEKRTRRTDLVFVWEALPNTAGTKGKARVDLQAGVYGNKIGDWNQYIKVPEDWTRARLEKSYYSFGIFAARAVLVVALLSVAVFGLVDGIRKGSLNWKPAARIAIIAMALELLNIINNSPQYLFNYDTQIDLHVYLVTTLAQEFLLLIGIGLAAGIAAAALMACYPATAALLSKRGGFYWSRDCAACISATVGLYLILQTVASQLQFRAYRLMPAPVLLIPESIGSYIPLISILHNVALSALFYSAAVALAIRLWHALDGRWISRTGLLLCLFVGVMPFRARQIPELLAGAVPLLILLFIVLILVLFFLRNNYLAYMLCAAALSMSRTTFLAASRGGSALIVQTAFLWALGLMGLMLLHYRAKNSASRGY